MGNNNSLKAVRTFQALPATIQQNVSVLGGAIASRVCWHANQILIGPPGNSASPEEINHATGVSIWTGERLILATAAHVVKKYRARRSAGEDVVFQVGNIPVNPEDRILWIDEKRDVVLLHIECWELQLLPGLTWMAPAWPPSPPNPGEYVAFAGYANEYREDLGPGQVKLNLVGGMMQATSSPGESIKCVVPRETLVPIIGDHVPPADSEHGGMSGGPVFRVNADSLDLVGIVTDFGPSFDVFLLATFAEISLAAPERR